MMLTTKEMTDDLAKANPYMKMVVNILRAGKILDHKVSEALKEFGITHIQFNILRILEAGKPGKLSLGEIKEGLLFPTSDVSRLLDRLVKRDLVERTICFENRRKLEVSITEEGLEVIRQSLAKIEKKLDGYYKDAVSENERDQIIDIMKRIS
ncbi:MAG: MarR family transcriptional regulator [Bacteroidales bacterium]|nr:MarR family transcriptional regulator [Bacteroidales bacterium]